MTALAIIAAVIAAMTVGGLVTYAWYWMHTWPEHQGEMTILEASEILMKKARRE